MSFSDTVRAATRENTSTDLTVFGAKMCSRQAVSKRLLRSYTAAFLDGIFWSASRFSVPKNELESGSPPPKCGPKNGTVFGALGIRANIRILPAGSKNGSQFRSRFWSHFFTLFGMHFIAFFAQNKRKTSKITISFLLAAKAASTCCTRGDNDSNNIVFDHELFRHSGGPSNTWQKISTIFGPRSRSVTAQKI